MKTNIKIFILVEKFLSNICFVFNPFVIIIVLQITTFSRLFEGLRNSLLINNKIIQLLEITLNNNKIIQYLGIILPQNTRI